MDTVQLEKTFYYPGDSEKPCQAPAPAPVAAGNCVLGSGIENKLSELIRVQAQAMQQQSQAMRQQQGIYRESVEVNREQTKIFRKQSELKEQEVHLKGAADIQMKDMPVFDGSDGLALENFFQEFERCRSAGLWGDLSALCRLRGCLRGIAAKEFDAAGHFDNVDQAKQALFDKFL